MATSQAVERLSSGAHWAYQVPFTHYQALLATGRKDEALVALEQAYQAVLDLLKGLPPDKQRLSLERQPEFRAVVAAWRAGGGSSLGEKIWVRS